MKNLKSHLLLFAALFLSLAAGAQNSSQWTPRGGAQVQSQAISRGASTNALVLNLNGVDRKLVEKVWVDFLKSEHGLKAKKVPKSNDYAAEDARISGINSGQAVKLLGRANEAGQSVQFNLIVEGLSQPAGGDTRYAFASYDDGLNGAWTLLDKFRIAVEREKVGLQLEEEEKKLRKLERDLEQLKNANERYHREIKEAEERIAKAKQDIITNERDQETANGAINEQRRTLESVREQLNKIN